MRFSIFHLLASIDIVVTSVLVRTHLYYSALFKLIRAMVSISRPSCPAAQAQATEIDFWNYPCEERPERWHTAAHDANVNFKNAISLTLAICSLPVGEY